MGFSLSHGCKNVGISNPGGQDEEGASQGTLGSSKQQVSSG